MSAAVPAWLRSYERGWLRPDLIAGLVIWSVVTPQAVAYAQIAGLPPEAGLMAAPVAMLAYQVDPNRDLVAMGAANALSGLSSGFVQAGGASQTAAADGAGGRSQLASLVAAGLILLTGAFLAPLFEDLPQATLAAIVIVAVAGFFDFAELRRFVRVRRSAIVFAAIALAGVLVLGVLQGLIVAAGLTLVYVVARLSRPRSARSRATPPPARAVVPTATRTGSRRATCSRCAATGRCCIPTPTRSRTACSARGRSGRDTRGRTRSRAVHRARPADR